MYSCTETTYRLFLSLYICLLLYVIKNTTIAYISFIFCIKSVEKKFCNELPPPPPVLFSSRKLRREICEKSKYFYLLRSDQMGLVPTTNCSNYSQGAR